jgi:hypothetical protein
LKAVNVGILERNQKRAAKGFALKPKKQNHKLNHADILLVFFLIKQVANLIAATPTTMFYPEKCWDA